MVKAIRHDRFWQGRFLDGSVDRQERVEKTDEQDRENGVSAMHQVNLDAK